AGCASCHVPRLSLREDSILGRYDVRLDAYTDLGLHDLGHDLYEATPDGTPVTTKWRTTPLWGLGKYELIAGALALLHDGRASSIEEAILWHDGEARLSKQKFLDAIPENRSLLLCFLKSL